MSEPIRINKYIAMAGVCSRRDADKLIEEGKVTLNGRVAVCGDKVSENDSVKVGSKLVKACEDKVILAYYKPVGVTCTERDAHAEVMVSDLVRYKDYRLTYAGRLDKDSEGLLIMTNDGDLIHEMMQAANAHEKEYLVTINKPVTEELVNSLSKGVFIKEFNRKTRPCKVKKTGPNTFSIVLTEGMNREIRRMCEAFGVKVTVLKRVRILTVTLNGLKTGEYRVLSDEEIAKLYEALGR